MSDILKIGKYELKSRLIVGSGKYDSFQTTLDATLASAPGQARHPSLLPRPGALRAGVLRGRSSLRRGGSGSVSGES